MADFHILRFKKRIIKFEEARIEKIKTLNALMMPELESSHFGDNESHGIASEKSEISNAMLPQKTKLKTTKKTNFKETHQRREIIKS